jgi:hypothetical protein
MSKYDLLQYLENLLNKSEASELVQGLGHDNVPKLILEISDEYQTI